MVKRTKFAIVEAFNVLIEVKPFEDISVMDIVREADVSKATFYRYFKDKYDVMNSNYKELLDEFSKRCGGVGWLCNKPYSGTVVINDYGKEHLETGKLIVYTSADSVFQIAAHEELYPPEKLYEFCRIARELLVGDLGVGRVIARPFVGSGKGRFSRTGRRRDFSLEPISPSILDVMKEAGYETLGVGKIEDIFAGKGLTGSNHAAGNPA